MDSSHIRVADYVAGFLSHPHFGPIFLVTGGFAMHLNDAVASSPNLVYVCNHHEQASAMAADGWARQSGGVGVVMTTGGPGATNLVTGIAEAWVDSIPLLIVAGTNARAQTVRGSGIAGLRQMGFLEIDPLPIVESITNYAVSVCDPLTIRHHLEKALHLATTGRPGPVFIEIPLDVQGFQIDPSTLAGFVPPALELPGCAAQVASLIHDIHHAKRPLLLAGQGVRLGSAVDAFRNLALHLGIPVVTTQMAKDLLPYSDPLFTGHCGIRGDRAGNHAVQNCDLLITLGSSLQNQTAGYDLELFAPRAKRVQVELDPAIRQRANHFEVHIAADCLSFIEELRAQWTRPPLDEHQRWRTECRERKFTFASRHEPHVFSDLDGPANLYELFWQLSELAEPNTTFITDSGHSKIVAGTGLHLREGQRYLANGGLGGMGWGLPAAIGTALAAPDRHIVAVIGDGSLQTNVHELQTLSHHLLNVKLFIVNNGGYASIRATQRQYFPGRAIGCDGESGLSLPPLDKLAAAYGLPYFNCPNRGLLHDRVSAALHAPGPFICGVEVRRDQSIIPYVASQKQADGSMRSAPLESMSPPLDAPDFRRSRPVLEVDSLALDRQRPVLNKG